MNIIKVIGYSKPVVDAENVTIPIHVHGGSVSLQWPLKMFVKMATQVVGPTNGKKRRPTIEMAYELWKGGTRGLSRRTICRRFKLRFCDFDAYARHRECEEEIEACDQRIICVLSREAA